MTTVGLKGFGDVDTIPIGVDRTGSGPGPGPGPGADGFGFEQSAGFESTGPMILLGFGKHGGVALAQ